MHTYFVVCEGVPDEEFINDYQMFYMFSITLEVDHNIIDKGSPIN